MQERLRSSSIPRGRLSLKLYIFPTHLNLLFLSDEGATLETLDYTVRIGSTPTFLYFDLYLYSDYAGDLL